MNIRTFRAESLQEGLRQIREELGDSVRILHTRQTDETSFFGLRKHKLVEITVEECAEKEYADASAAGKKTLSQPKDLRPPLTMPLSDNNSNNNSDNNFNNNRHSFTLEQLNPTVLQRNMAAKLTQTVKFSGGLNLKSDVCRIAAFIGPAGTGKTSLIMKLAAHYKNNENKKTAVITTDMFSIAAVEQMQKYGEMLSIAVETSSEPRRIIPAVQRLSSNDLILIDTPAVSPQNRERLQFVNETLLAAEADDIQLVLPATGSTDFLTENVRRFAPLHPTGLSLTHLDEAVGMSALYPFLQKQELPLCFFSLGQNITKDIEPASAARLVCLI